MAVPLRRARRIITRGRSILSSFHRHYTSATDEDSANPNLLTKHGHRPWISESGERLKLAPQDTNKYWIQRLKALTIEPAPTEASVRVKARELQLALDEFNSRTKLKPIIGVYNHILNALASVDDFEAALALFLELKEADGFVDTYTLASVFNAAAASDEVDLTQLENLHQVTRDGNLPRSTVTYNALLTALYRHKAYSAMDAVFHDMSREHDKKRNEPDAITITLMMRAAAALNNTARRDQLFQLAKLTRQTDTGVIGAMLDAASQEPVRHKDGTTLKLVVELSERLYRHLADNSAGDDRRTGTSLRSIIYAQFRHLPSNEERLQLVQRLRTLTAASDELQATLLQLVVDVCHQIRFRKWRAFLTDASQLWADAGVESAIAPRVRAALELDDFPQALNLLKTCTQSDPDVSLWSQATQRVLYHYAQSNDGAQLQSTLNSYIQVLQQTNKHADAKTVEMLIAAISYRPSTARLKSITRDILLPKVDIDWPSARQRKPIAWVPTAVTLGDGRRLELPMHFYSMSTPSHLFRNRKINTRLWPKLDSGLKVAMKPVWKEWSPDEILKIALAVHVGYYANQSQQLN